MAASDVKTAIKSLGREEGKKKSQKEGHAVMVGLLNGCVLRAQGEYSKADEVM